MKILAVDPSTTSCGVFDGVTPETWVFKGNRPVRFAAFAERLSAKLKEAADTDMPFDVVIYEYAFARGADATRCGWGMDGIIEALATSGGCAVIDVQNSALKAWARSRGAEIIPANKKKKVKGNGKQGMIDFVLEKFGIAVSSDDEADAISAWNYAREKAVVR